MYVYESMIYVCAICMHMYGRGKRSARRLCHSPHIPWRWSVNEPAARLRPPVYPPGVLELLASKPGLHHPDPPRAVLFGSYPVFIVF